MKVLVVGGGGREHALVWKIAQSSPRPEIIAAPGNPGIAAIARTAPVEAQDVEGLVRLAREEACDLTVVGPELPLTLGLADRLAEEGLAVFGPSRTAARLEGSKWFAKDLMLRAGIPTASAWLAGTREEALGRAREVGFPVVIKADGLAAGKGVVVARSEEEATRAIDDAIVRRCFGYSGERVLIEEFLEGEEASILAFTDGERTALLVPSQDHKRALDGDAGPNTGGMGAYAPVPSIDGKTLAVVRERIIEAAIQALRSFHGTVYRGVIYAGLMITSHGPKVIEFNCRFGDPEAQAILPLLRGDLTEIMESVARGELDPSMVRAHDGAAACVVLASRGYPGAYEKGKTVSGLEDVRSLDGVTVFHSGTAVRDGVVVSAGGRVLGVTGVGRDLRTAVDRAYGGVRAVGFEGAHYRTDIGHRALERVRSQ